MFHVKPEERSIGSLSRSKFTDGDATSWFGICDWSLHDELFHLESLNLPRASKVVRSCCNVIAAVSFLTDLRRSSM